MKKFNITFHESQTGRKVIDLIADDDNPDEPAVVSFGHKRNDSLDLSQSTLHSSNDPEKSSPYVNIDEEDTEPLDPMFQSDEDIFISDDGTMITKHA